MSAALDRLKQQNEQSGSPQQLGSPDMMETLTSILAAVEAQNARIDRLAEQQKKLAGFVKVMDEELAKRIDRASTSQQSVGMPPQIESVESRLSEIESTLSEFVKSLDGKRLSAASQSLIAEAQKNHAATASAIDGLKAQAAANQKLVGQVGGAVQRIEKRTEDRVAKAVEQVAGEAGQVVTAKLDASNAWAERIIAATAKLEARQLWSAAAAMCLALLPVAVVVAGLWMGIAGLITGTQWALDVDGSVWLGIGRWLVVAVGIAGAGYGLFASARWVAGLVETWRGRG
ncbi:hypothetical protein ACSAGD_12810 [Paramicrobacterium sp. CJ85]|uniref:Uncharacterized protein n=1 Tax=Ornithinicoccus hortensis TaxID=82346 RepID=A0A542YN39_9MICO|nr:hypothetical protein FB467_0423 [Ornithinicoccus hortensis]